jgi:hypothetical protein
MAAVIDAGGHETGGRGADRGIEPAALAEAELQRGSYFLGMRRDTSAVAHGLRNRFKHRRHYPSAFYDRTSSVTVGVQPSAVYGQSKARLDAIASFLKNIFE